MEGLPVSYSLNSGDNGNNWWGDFIGAAIGGAAGAAWGRGNNNGCCGNGGGGCCNNNDQFIMDTLTTMRTDVNGIGRDQLIQTQQIGQGICQGFGGIATEIANLGSQLSQGQCRTEAAVLTTGLNGQIQQKDNTIAQLNAAHAVEMQGMRNTFDIVSSQKDCCCTTNANIERQGCQTREVILAEGCATRATIRDEQDKTRALISQLDREQLLRESAAKDAKIAQLEAFQFNTALAAGNAQQTRNEMQGQTALILAALRDRTSSSSGGAAA